MSTSITTSIGEAALVLGATGATGKHILREALALPSFTKVIEAGRRVTPPETLANVPGKEKLVQKVIDFENLPAAELKSLDADVVIIALGTTKADAGSAEKFVKIDREYVIDAAKEAKVDGKDQRLVYLSSMGANAHSMFLYPQSKGLTEQGLSKLGYKDFLVFRPGFLKNAERPKKRLGETIASGIYGIIPFGKSSIEIDVPLLAKSIVKASSLGSNSLPSTVTLQTLAGDGFPSYKVIGNSDAIKLTSEST